MLPSQTLKICPSVRGLQPSMSKVCHFYHQCKHASTSGPFDTPETNRSQFTAGLTEGNLQEESGAQTYANRIEKEASISLSQFVGIHMPILTEIKGITHRHKFMTMCVCMCVCVIYRANGLLMRGKLVMSVSNHKLKKKKKK